MSLSSRLAISYALIILITLFLAFFTLIVASRPIQNRVAQAQLRVVAGTAATQLNRLVRLRGSQAELIDRVNSAATGDVRLLLTDAQGLTLADSGSSWIGQPLAIGEGDPQGQSLAGNFRDPDRNLAMYAAEALGASNQTAGYVVAVRPRAPLFPNVIRDLAQGFMLAGLVALLISLLVGVVLARTIALPLQRIAQAAGAVATGDYRQRVPVRGPP
nr:HAMP domain-containing protein [Anaerolineae bacterium]